MHNYAEVRQALCVQLVLFTGKCEENHGIRITVRMVLGCTIMQKQTERTHGTY